MDLSSNPLGTIGVKYIAKGISSSFTLTSLNISRCCIEAEGMDIFQKALSQNPFIVKLEVHNNPISTLLELKTLAEAAVNRHMLELRNDPHGMDCNGMVVMIPLQIILML